MVWSTEELGVPAPAADLDASSASLSRSFFSFLFKLTSSSTSALEIELLVPSIICGFGVSCLSDPASVDIILPQSFVLKIIADLQFNVL